MVSYDVFKRYFKSKISQYSFSDYGYDEEMDEIDRFLHLAIAEFKNICVVDLSDRDDDARVFNSDDVNDDEIIDILTDGMVCVWLKKIKNEPQNLQNYLDTKDFQLAASPANVLKEVRTTYELEHDIFVGKMLEYSYNHGDISSLHM